MPDNIGSHLLGRKYEKDERDIPMRKALEVKAAPKIDSPGDEILDKTVRQVIDEGVFFNSWQGILAFWRWVKNFLKTHPSPSPTPTPIPTPTPVSKEKVWNLDDYLDQGNTGHCVGFGWTGWYNAAPTEHNESNAYGHAWYYDAKIFDGEPNAENGSYVRSGAKVAKQRGFLTSYVFAHTVEEIKQWVLNYGPVVVGSDWYNNMFDTDVNGFVKPTGGIAGGHCFILIGYSPDTDIFLFQNSWGRNWGLGGRFKMKASDFDTLLQAQGEACASTEIPKAALVS